MSDVTRMLEALAQGDRQVAEELLPLVYDELRQLAAAKLARETPGQTLQPTALVHEAWLRLAGDGQPVWQGRRHFFGAATEAMRRILIDRARTKARLRHGGHLERVELDHVTVAVQDADDTVLAVADALERFGRQDPVKAEMVKLRYFIGLNHAEIAEVMGLSEPTVRRYWAFARAWLHAELSAQIGGGSPAPGGVSNPAHAAQA
jgi:RNA polymerase sigma factor (TIGR02999 family)